MPLQYDPEFLEVFRPLVPLLAKRPQLTCTADIPASRPGREAAIEAFHSKLPDTSGVKQQIHYFDRTDGHRLSVLALTPAKEGKPKPGPCILHFHGGGMTIGTAELYAKPLARLVSQTSMPIFSVNYRLAPEHSGTGPVEDCYAALVWLHLNAAAHNIDPGRIAVFGESAGGGLAAGVALMARDADLQPPLAKQILVYPMLDDRNMTSNEAIEPFAFFTTKENILGWTALLGDQAGQPDAQISPYAAPARASDLKGLPSTYIDTGGLDTFRDECVAYATRLMAANIGTELHVYPGLPHAFELLAPDIRQTKEALANRLRALMEF